MRPITLFALTAAFGLVAALAAPPAEAQTRKRAVKRPGAVVVVGRAPTRLTVRRRSFLDPGTESLPFDRHYHDYAVSPDYSVWPRGWDHSVSPGSWSRMPLPGLWDVPGYVR